MPYITVADVTSEFKNTSFLSGTSVTSAEVAEFITQEQNEIDAIVGMAYSVPVASATSPNTYSLLKKYNITLVKNRVEHILKMDAGTDADNTVDDRQEKVIERLEKLVDKKQLHDAERIASDSYGVKDYNYTNSISATFTTSSQQW